MPVGAETSAEGAADFGVSFSSRKSRSFVWPKTVWTPAVTTKIVASSTARNVMNDGRPPAMERIAFMKSPMRDSKLEDHRFTRGLHGGHNRGTLFPLELKFSRSQLRYRRQVVRQALVWNVLRPCRQVNTIAASSEDLVVATRDE